MGCGSSGTLKHPPRPVRPHAVAASDSPEKTPPMLVQAPQIAGPGFNDRGDCNSRCEMASGFAVVDGTSGEAPELDEAPPSSATLRCTAEVSPRAGAPKVSANVGVPYSRSPSIASDQSTADAISPFPPPMPMAPRAMVTPPMAVRSQDGVRTPTSSSSHPSRMAPFACWMEDSLEGSTIMGANSPRHSGHYSPHTTSPRSFSAGALSTSPSTPRRFHHPPSSRGLKCGIVGEDEIFDLYEESQFETPDKAVSMEIKGWMANIHMDILDGGSPKGGNRGDVSPAVAWGGIGTPSKRSHQSLSTEEERLMQQILEDDAWPLVMQGRCASQMPRSSSSLSSSIDEHGGGEIDTADYDPRRMREDETA